MGVYAYDATGRQKILIAQLCMALKIREPIEERPMSYGVAGELIRNMCYHIKMEREGGVSMYERGDQREALVCDRCGRTYADERSVSMAKEESENWAAMCRADGVEPRGITPCPDMGCRGELLLQTA